MLPFDEFERHIRNRFKSRDASQIPVNVSTVYGSEKPSGADLHAYLCRRYSRRRKVDPGPQAGFPPKRPRPGQCCGQRAHAGSRTDFGMVGCFVLDSISRFEMMLVPYGPHSFDNVDSDDERLLARCAGSSQRETLLRPYFAVSQRSSQF